MSGCGLFFLIFLTFIGENSKILSFYVVVVVVVVVVVNDCGGTAGCPESVGMLVQSLVVSSSKTYLSKSV